MFIDVNCRQVAARLGQDIAQSMIAGVFNRCFSALGKQHLRGQPKRILGSECDQYLFWAGNDAAPWQRVTRDKLDQLWIILIVIIGGQRGKVFLT